MFFVLAVVNGVWLHNSGVFLWDVAMQGTVAQLRQVKLYTSKDS